jgi:hypothetical protein
MLGFCKELKAYEDDQGQESHREQAAHITAAAAGALPLKIGIAEFCQGLLPIRLRKTGIRSDGDPTFRQGLEARVDYLAHSSTAKAMPPSKHRLHPKFVSAVRLLLFLW